MKHYQISKFDKSKNSYVMDWTSAAQVIRATGFSSDTLPVEYLRVEHGYLRFVSSFLHKVLKDEMLIPVERPVLNFDNREISSESDTQLLLRHSMFGEYGREVVSTAKKNEVVSIADALCLVQLALRELVHMQLRPTENSYVVVGDDYYLLLGAPESVDVLALPGAQDLYVYETANSPWG